MTWFFSVIDPASISNDKRVVTNKLSAVYEADNLEECAQLLLQFPTVAGVTHNDIRAGKDFKFTQFLRFDFDDGTNPKTVAIRIKKKLNCSFLMMGSKNHRKDKGDGRGRIPRFHLYIPVQEPIKDLALYTNLIKYISLVLDITPDPACKDALRYFFPSSKIIKVYDTNKYLSKEQYQHVVNENDRINDKFHRIMSIVKEKETEDIEGLFSDEYIEDLESFDLTPSVFRKGRIFKHKNSPATIDNLMKTKAWQENKDGINTPGIKHISIYKIACAARLINLDEQLLTNFLKNQYTGDNWSEHLSSIKGAYK